MIKLNDILSEKAMFRKGESNNLPSMLKGSREYKVSLAAAISIEYL